jgi:hypothetical protein
MVKKRVNPLGPRTSRTRALEIVLITRGRRYRRPIRFLERSDLLFEGANEGLEAAIANGDMLYRDLVDHCSVLDAKAAN